MTYDIQAKPSLKQTSFFVELCTVTFKEHDAHTSEYIVNYTTEAVSPPYMFISYCMVLRNIFHKNSCSFPDAKKKHIMSSYTKVNYGWLHHKAQIILN